MLSAGVHRSRPTLASLQQLRGVAVLLVLAYHLSGVGARALGLPDTTGRLVHAQAGVDLFFVISGYVMVLVSCTDRGEARVTPGGFLARRVLRIYPLYWLVSLPLLGVFLAAPSWFHSRAGPVAAFVVRSFLLFPQTSSPLVGQGWSLVHEMYFYLGFALLLALAPRYPGRALALWLLAVLAGATLFGPFDQASEPWTRTLFHPLTCEFLGGAALALWHAAAVRPGATFGVAAGLTVWGASLLHPEFALHGWLRACWDGSAALLLVHGLVTRERLGRRTLGVWFEKIGDASYSIYLTHLALLAVLALGWRHFAGSPGTAFGGALTLVGIGTLTVLGGEQFYRWIEQPLTQATRRLRKSG